MKESLVRVVYVSRNTIEGDDDGIAAEIESILEVARQANTDAGITGALMFNRGLFAQVLEGPSDTVEQTFERIQCDQRHTDVSLLALDPVNERSFDHWSMAYVGTAAEIPSRLLEIATETGFDPARIDGNDVHETLRSLLLEDK